MNKKDSDFPMIGQGVTVKYGDDGTFEISQINIPDDDERMIAKTETMLIHGLAACAVASGLSHDKLIEVLKNELDYFEEKAKEVKKNAE